MNRRTPKYAPERIESGEHMSTQKFVHERSTGPGGD